MVHGSQLTVDKNIEARGSVVRTQAYISCIAGLQFTVYGCSKHKTVNCKPTTVNLIITNTFTSTESIQGL